MDIESLKDALGDEKFAALKSHIEDIVGQRDAARNESINGRKGKDAKIAEQAARIAELADWAGIEPDADLSALPAPKGQADAAKQYDAKLKRMQRDLEAAAAQRDEVSSKYRSTLQRAAIQEALGGHEFIARDVVETYVSQRLAWEGDELMGKADDGRLIPVRDLVAGIAKSRPELLKPTGSGGAGVRASNAGGNAGAKTMTRAEFEALPPSAKVEAAKSGVTLT